MAHLDDRAVASLAPRARLDLKKVRLAVHGWKLGNPLTYKPGASDLLSVARALADSGLPSGALVLDDVSGNGATRLVLILREDEPPRLLAMAAACAVADVVEGALGAACAVRWPWDVALRARGAPWVCRVGVEGDLTGRFTLLSLRLAFGRIGSMEESAAAPLLTRADWREVLLARALHTLDARLGALGGAERESEWRLLQEEWRERSLAPYRARITNHDGVCREGVVERITPDGALLLRLADGSRHACPPDDARAVAGLGWTTTGRGAAR
ncbi:MAG TPA: hypothetical protein VF725_05265 [Ktedonobacterales bacterium]